MAGRPSPKRTADAQSLGPALGLIECSSIARGIVVADAMLKRAACVLRWSRPVSPGKFLVLVDGEIAEVDEAMEAGLLVADSALVDKLFLPGVHSAIGPKVAGEIAHGPLRSVAVIETATCASAIVAADAALKCSDVALVELRLAQGIGGKAYFTLSGGQSDVEAAADAAASAIDPAHLIGKEVIASLHEELSSDLLRR